MKQSFQEVRKQLNEKGVTLLCEKIGSDKYVFYIANIHGFIKKKYDYLFEIVNDYGLE